MGSHPNITKEDLIQRLKDDGHFDELRLKFIRTLRDKEELRNSVIAMVKQSEALNRAGNENLKPRQFCDAIYEEIHMEAMKQISEELLAIIKSEDGLLEITTTIQSVFNKLVNPKGDGEGNSSCSNVLGQFQNGNGNDSSQKRPTSEINDPTSDNELNEPPGFSISDTHQNKNHGEQKGEQQQPLPSEKGPTVEQNEESNHAPDVLEPLDVDHGVPPGFSSTMGNMQIGDGSDEDPDVPPGFG